MQIGVALQFEVCIGVCVRSDFSLYVFMVNSLLDFRCVCGNAWTKIYLK